MLLTSDEAAGLAMSSIFMGGVITSYCLPGGLAMPKQVPGFCVSALVAYVVTSQPPLRSRLLGTAIRPSTYAHFAAIGVVTGVVVHLTRSD